MEDFVIVMIYMFAFIAMAGIASTLEILAEKVPIVGRIGEWMKDILGIPDLPDDDEDF